MIIDSFIRTYILTFIYVGLCLLSIAIGREGGVAPLIALARSEAEVIYFLYVQCLYVYLINVSKHMTMLKNYPISVRALISSSLVLLAVFNVALDYSRVVAVCPYIGVFFKPFSLLGLCINNSCL